MPIVVQQPGIAGQAAGQLMAQGLQAEASRKQADIQQLRQIEANRNEQLMQIQAAAEQQQQAAENAMQQMAAQAGLGQQMADDAYEREIGSMQEKARLEANQWETKFTAQQRQEIQKLNNAVQAVSQDPTFSEEEKAAAIRNIQLAQAGIAPSMMPKEPGQKEYEPGQGRGDTWVDNEGHTRTMNIEDGRVVMLAKYSEGREATENKRQADMEAKQVQSRVKLRSDFVRSYQSSHPNHELPNDQLVEDALRLMDPVYAERKDAERDRIASETQQAAATEQEAASQEFEQNWPQRAEAEGLNVKVEDLDLPPMVGYATAYVRTATNNGTIPLSELPEHQKVALMGTPENPGALRIISEYMKSIGMPVPEGDVFADLQVTSPEAGDLLDTAVQLTRPPGFGKSRNVPRVGIFGG